jgi:hypothetical protein
VGVPIGPKSKDPAAPALPLVTDLGYAGDVSLCSSTPRGLQRLIDYFCACCSEEGLIVVVGGAKAWSRKSNWTLQAPGGGRTPLAV